jgi:hypothetical protein
MVPKRQSEDASKTLALKREKSLNKAIQTNELGKYLINIDIK